MNKKVGMPNLRKKSIRFYDFIYMPWVSEESFYGIVRVNGYISCEMTIDAWRRKIEDGYYAGLIQKLVTSISFMSQSGMLVVELEDN